MILFIPYLPRENQQESLKKKASITSAWHLFRQGVAEDRSRCFSKWKHVNKTCNFHVIFVHPLFTKTRSRETKEKGENHISWVHFCHVGLGWREKFCRWNINKTSVFYVIFLLLFILCSPSSHLARTEEYTDYTTAEGLKLPSNKCPCNDITVLELCWTIWNGIYLYTYKFWIVHHNHLNLSQKIIWYKTELLVLAMLKPFNCVQTNE